METMKNKTDISQIRKHAARNITLILDRLGIRYSQHGTLIQSVCPCQQHGGDRNNSTAFSWKIDYKAWVCWTHHCNEVYGNDAFGLVRSVLDLSFSESVEWIYDTLTNKNVDVTVEVKETVQKKPGLHIHEPINEKDIKFLIPQPKFLLDRGFSLEVLDQYQVGVWPRIGTFMGNRVVIPVRDHDGHLIGYTARALDTSDPKNKKWIHGKYFHRWPRPDDFFTGSILFNLNRAKNYLGKEKKLFLVEGPLDGFKLEMAGIYNWVATFGTAFRSTHRTLLVRYGVNKLVVAYDNETRKEPDKLTSGEHGWDAVCKTVGSLFDIERLALPIDVDPGAMSITQIQEIFI